MTTMRIEHPVLDYEAWKRAFDGDPIGRERSGVRRYRILRATDDPDYVMIDLEFDGADAAHAMLGSLQAMWGQVQGTMVPEQPRVRIVEQVEAAEY